MVKTFWSAPLDAHATRWPGKRVPFFSQFTFHADHDRIARLERNADTLVGCAANREAGAEALASAGQGRSWWHAGSRSFVDFSH